MVVCLMPKAELYRELPACANRSQAPFKKLAGHLAQARVGVASNA
jgi:hypothetical protein